MVIKNNNNFVTIIYLEEKVWKVADEEKKIATTFSNIIKRRILVPDIIKEKLKRMALSL